jgi:hypothetical protein
VGISVAMHVVVVVELIMDVLQTGNVDLRNKWRLFDMALFTFSF